MNMRFLKVILPIGAMAAGAAAYLIVSKMQNGEGTKEKPAKSAKGKTAEIKNPRTGNYSFVSGYSELKTINVDWTYDMDKFSFDVAEDDFPSESRDSHVAIVSGPDFTAQIEYASYYKGDDFAALMQHSEENFKGYESVMYGLNEGFKYMAGDNMCLCFPAADDEYSYILITIMKSKDCDLDFRTLPDHPDMKAMLEAMQISST